MKTIEIQKHEDVGINSVRDLTKEELLECISCAMEHNGSAKFWFEREILHIADRRRQKKLEADEEKASRLIDLQKEYYELINPYLGKNLSEWPDDVVEKGAALERQIIKAKKEYYDTFESSLK